LQHVVPDLALGHDEVYLAQGLVSVVRVVEPVVLMFQVELYSAAVKVA